MARWLGTENRTRKWARPTVRSHQEDILLVKG